MKLTPTLPTPSTCPHLSERRPSASRSRPLTSGIAASSQNERSTPVAEVYSTASNACICPSVLQKVRVVDARGASRTEDRHDDGQADHDFGGGDDHNEERHDLPVQGAVD